MMDITINLTPPETQKKLKHLVTFIFIKEILEVSLLVSILLATTLTLGWYVLQNEFNNLAESAMLVDKEFSVVNQEIRQTNMLIKKVNAASQNYASLAPKLLEVVNILPGTIKLNAINIDRKNSALALTGTALTRAALLDFKESIRQLSWLKEVNAPVSQLLQKENINFEIRATIIGLPLLPTTKQKVTHTAEEGEY